MSSLLSSLLVPSTKTANPPSPTSLIHDSSHSSRTRSIVGTVRQAFDRGNIAPVQQSGSGILDAFRRPPPPDPRQIVRDRMVNAESREDWEAAAKELDALEGNLAWKTDDSALVACAAGENDYNPELIAERLRELDKARASGDPAAMMHTVRTCLSRDLGGVGNADLYRHCHLGTKTLVERYVQSSLQSIDAIVKHATSAASAAEVSPQATDASSNFSGSLPTELDEASAHHILDGLLHTRQTFGRSALLLSGGGTFGMAHIGVIKSLFEAALLPRIISGASAGSIVSAVLCTHTDEEMPQLIREFPHGDLSVFDDPASGGENRFFSHLRLLLTQGSWSDIRHLSRVMRGLVGDLTFQEAYNRTRRILNICVSTARVYELPCLLNYVTAPNVMIWSAVAASCSVPLVFGAAPLLAKDPKTGAHCHWDPTPHCSWIDGSVENDLPMTRLSEMFNVNHFIVSQVNPHVVPFLQKDEADLRSGRAAPSRGSLFDLTDLKSGLASLARDEVMHRLRFLSELGIFPNVMTKLCGVLSQKYSGDITILPQLSVRDLPYILTNPTSDFMRRLCLLGEQATWPKLSRIRDRCALELALDRAVHRVRAYILFESMHADLCKFASNQCPHSLVVAGTDDKHAPTLCLCQMVPRRRRRRRSSGCSSQLLVIQDHGKRTAIEDDNPLTGYGPDEDERHARIMDCHATASLYGTPSGRHRHKVRLRRAFRSHINLTHLYAEHHWLPGARTAPIDEAHTALEQERKFKFETSATLQPSRNDFFNSRTSSNVLFLGQRQSNAAVLPSQQQQQQPQQQQQSQPQHQQPRRSLRWAGSDVFHSPSSVSDDSQNDAGMGPMDGSMTITEPDDTAENEGGPRLPFERRPSRASFGGLAPSVFPREDASHGLGHRVGPDGRVGD